MRLLPRHVLTLLCLLWTLLAGCGSPPEATSVHLVGEQPAERFSIRTIATDVVLEADLDGAGASWLSEEPDDRTRRSERGLVVETSGKRLTLLASDAWKPSRFDLLTVTLVAVRIIRPSLALRGPGCETRLEPLPELTLDNDERSFHFDMTAVEPPCPVTELRLIVDLPADEPVTVRGIRALAVSGAAFDAAARRPWRLDVGHEVRDGWLLVPGRPIVRRVDVPRGGVLHFAVAASGRLSAPVTVRVRARPEGGGSRLLWERRLGRSDRGRWHDARVDLGSLGGQALELSVDSSSEGTFDPVAGVPVWAGPMVVPEVPPGSRPNVVLISVDTLRADHLSLYGYAGETSPWIDAWARRAAVTFLQAVAPAPYTLPSHTSMLTGRDTLGHGVNWPMRPAPRSLRTLAEELRAAGYHTVAVTGGGWLGPDYGLAQGFDRFRYWGRPGAGDAELAAHAPLLAGLLPRLPEPFFLFLHTNAVHDYLAPKGPSPLADRVRIERYDRAVRRLDQKLGPLLDQLAARPRTAVALTADHGEAHGEPDGERKDYGHASLRDPVLRVPLVLAWPDGARWAGRKRSEQVRLIDLAPTLYEIAGVGPPPALDGVSLLNVLAGAAPPSTASSYFSFRGLSLRVGNRWKYTVDNTAWYPDSGRERLYRLDRDPGESADLARDHRRRSEGFRRSARRWLDERLTGLVVRWYNRSDVPFETWIRSADVVSRKVKTTRWDCACARLEQDGLAAISVPAGEDFEIVFEQTTDPEIRILAVPDDPAPLRLWISPLSPPAEARRHSSRSPLRRLGAAVAFAWTGEGWIEWQVTADDKPDVGVELFWRPTSFTGEPALYEQNTELRRQLEALGYL